MSSMNVISLTKYKTKRKEMATRVKVPPKLMQGSKDQNAKWFRQAQYLLKHSGFYESAGEELTEHQASAVLTRELFSLTTLTSFDELHPVNLSMHPEDLRTSMSLHHIVEITLKRLYDGIFHCTIPVEIIDFIHVGLVDGTLLRTDRKRK